MPSTPIVAFGSKKAVAVVLEDMFTRMRVRIRAKLVPASSCTISVCPAANVHLTSIELDKFLF